MGDAALYVKRLLELPENQLCADCRTQHPTWASTTIGVFICLNCSGIHRNLGTHVTLVRSVTLDSWTTQQYKIMKKVGNEKGNKFFEERLPPSFSRPSTADRQNMERFIYDKYVRKLYAGSGPMPSLVDPADEYAEKVAARRRFNSTSSGNFSQKFAADNGNNSGNSNIKGEEYEKMKMVYREETKKAQKSNIQDLLGAFGINTSTNNKPSNAIQTHDSLPNQKQINNSNPNINNSKGKSNFLSNDNFSNPNFEYDNCKNNNNNNNNNNIKNEDENMNRPKFARSSMSELNTVVQSNSSGFDFINNNNNSNRTNNNDDGKKKTVIKDDIKNNLFKDVEINRLHQNSNENSPKARSRSPQPCKSDNNKMFLKRVSAYQPPKEENVVTEKKKEKENTENQQSRKANLKNLLGIVEATHQQPSQQPQLISQAKSPKQSSEDKNNNFSENNHSQNLCNFESQINSNNNNSNNIIKEKNECNYARQNDSPIRQRRTKSPEPIHQSAFGAKFVKRIITKEEKEEKEELLRKKLREERRKNQKSNIHSLMDKVGIQANNNNNNNRKNENKNKNNFDDLEFSFEIENDQQNVNNNLLGVIPNTENEIVDGNDDKNDQKKSIGSKFARRFITKEEYEEEIRMKEQKRREEEEKSKIKRIQKTKQSQKSNTQKLLGFVSNNKNPENNKTIIFSFNNYVQNEKVFVEQKRSKSPEAQKLLKKVVSSKNIKRLANEEHDEKVEIVKNKFVKDNSSIKIVNDNFIRFYHNFNQNEENDNNLGDYDMNPSPRKKNINNSSHKGVTFKKSISPNNNSASNLNSNDNYNINCNSNNSIKSNNNIKGNKNKENEKEEHNVIDKKVVSESNKKEVHSLLNQMTSKSKGKTASYTYSSSPISDIPKKEMKKNDSKNGVSIETSQNFAPTAVKSFKKPIEDHQPKSLKDIPKISPVSKAAIANKNARNSLTLINAVEAIDKKRK